MKIGLLGAAVSSDNMGCLALTYSLVAIFEKIEKENNLTFEYYFFDGDKTRAGFKEIVNSIGVDDNKLHNAHTGFWVPEVSHKFLRCIKSNVCMLTDVAKCDCVIDITGGDSFTDIYGDERFLQRTHLKNICHYFGKPIFLAPQTYGPFNKKKNLQMAARALRNADVVMTRDSISEKYVLKISGIKAICSNDLAFQLPYTRRTIAEIDSNKIKVGLNFSGLLVSQHYESTNINFSMKTDYDMYVKKISKYFSDKSQYEVYLIPHVTDDTNVHRALKNKYPQFHIIEKFDNPIEAKSFISGLDIFIGARMHGTIAAFTSGVACIPTAYSRKFKGIFQDCGYSVLVDLQELDTTEAVEQTLQYVSNYKSLQDEIQHCLPMALKKKEVIEDRLKKWILEQVQ